MRPAKHLWAEIIADISYRHPWWILAATLLITIVSLIFASMLEMRMNWTDTLPENDPAVEYYRNVQDRFGSSGAIVVALEGDYDRITAMADSLEPRLKKIESLYNVQGRLPLDYFRDHGFMLLKPNDFNRMLRTFSEPDLVGTLRGINDDYEREYTESESNLRRDEVNISRSLLGIHRSLEVLLDNLDNKQPASNIEAAVDALTLGESWLLSLDRSMLLIVCDPLYSLLEFDALLASVADVERVIDELRPGFPGVSADLTGFAKIGQDEMNSVGLYTVFLSLGVIILIFILLARAFNSWVSPVIAILPLLYGISWTMGLLYLLFQGLNIFTAMIMIVLLGLGIDFTIHIISRFNEEVSAGKPVRDALEIMLKGTGVAVLTGGLTTAAAFLTLLIGESRGVYEFGAAAGFGVLLTLLALFLVLPALLTIQTRWRSKRRRKAPGGTDAPVVKYSRWTFLGKIAETSWRRPAVFLITTIVIVAFSIWAKGHIKFEYDFLELEPKGLRSIELQREIPRRFGMSDHAAWVVCNSVEESRRMKDEFMKKPLVGDVAAISDYLPSTERVRLYQPQLTDFQQKILRTAYPQLMTGGPQDSESAQILREELSVEVNRLWDNLDLVSNLAFTAGLDRIVQVIDGITGTQSESGTTDETAVLPSLVRSLSSESGFERLMVSDAGWFDRMKANLHSMANPDPPAMDEIPEVISRTYLPRRGDGYLLHVIPRQAMWDKQDLVAFTGQANEVTREMTSTEHLTLLMFEVIIRDGRNAALLALLVIVILVIIHFRGPAGLLSLIPLAAGAMAMTALMYVIGEKYNYINLMAVPIILGIGIDDGIHALHRYRSEKGTGSDRIGRTFTHVGKAIMLTSLTTMIGFGSIAFYTMEGMASFGRALFMGVGACFFATIFVLPAVLRLVDSFGRKSG